MTKKELVKIIREVVKIEVKKQAKEIFINEYKKAKSSTLKSLAPKPKPVKKVAPQKRDFVTGNDALNDVLNETVGLAKNEKTDYPTVGGGTFDTARMTELLGYGKSDEMKRDMVAVDTIKKAGRSVDQVPDHVTNALTRDYSGLMKAIDKKKGK